MPKCPRITKEEKKSKFTNSSPFQVFRPEGLKASSTCPPGSATYKLVLNSGMIFASLEELILAIDQKIVSLHSNIKCRYKIVEGSKGGNMDHIVKF